MIIKCPHCGRTCKSDKKFVTSVELVCPYCEGSFIWDPADRGTNIWAMFVTVIFALSSIMFSLYCLLKTCDGMRFAVLVASLSVFVTRLWKGAGWTIVSAFILGLVDLILAGSGVFYLLCEDHYQVVDLIAIFASWFWLIGVGFLFFPKVVRAAFGAKYYRNPISWIAWPLTSCGILVASGFPGFQVPVIRADCMGGAVFSIVLAAAFSWIALLMMDKGESILGSHQGW